MSKLTVALLSFAAGVSSALLLSSGSHTSTRVQAAQGGFLNGVTNPRAEPELSGLEWVMELSGSDLGGTVQQLDGVSCERPCNIKASTVTYAGGFFRCVGCSISKQTLQLKGAAFNTFNVLRMFGVIPNPPAPSRPTNPPFPPIYRTDIPIAPRQNITIEAIAVNTR